MMKLGRIFPVLLLLVFFFSCSKDDSGSIEEVEEDEDDDEDDETLPFVVEFRDLVRGIRIAWDYHSLRLISEENSTGYNVYGGLIECMTTHSFAVYESKKSMDQGNSWGSAMIVAAFQNRVNMAIPDLIQLEDNSILVSYNPRPTNTADASEKFAIRTVRSLNRGNTCLR